MYWSSPERAVERFLRTRTLEELPKMSVRKRDARSGLEIALELDRATFVGEADLDDDTPRPSACRRPATPSVVGVEPGADVGRHAGASWRPVLLRM
jgi:hypothetical protein